VLIRTGEEFSDNSDGSLDRLDKLSNEFGSLLADCEDFYNPTNAHKSVEKDNIMEDDPMHEFIHSMGALNEADVDHSLP